MKSLKELSLDISEKEYRELPRYSYSQIAKYAREGLSCIPNLNEHISTISLIFGSLVDTLLTDKDNFKNIYHVVDELPTDGIKNVLDVLYDKWHPNKIKDASDACIQVACVEAGYYRDSKYAKTRLKNIRECEGDYYLAIKRTCPNKIIIDRKTYEEALTCVETLINHPYTSRFFVDLPFSDEEKYFQLKFIGEYEGIHLKCMVDLIIVDHEHKKIYPIDLKTTSKKEYEFAHNFLEWKYWIQAQLYTYLIKQNIEKDPFYKDYTVENYNFIVINKKSLSPMVWLFNQSSREDGFEIKIGGVTKKYRSWRVLLKQLVYYINQQCEVPFWVTESVVIEEYFSKWTMD